MVKMSKEHFQLDSARDEAGHSTVTYNSPSIKTHVSCGGVKSEMLISDEH